MEIRFQRVITYQIPEVSDLAGSVNLRAVVLDILGEVFDEGRYSHIVINNALTKFLYLEKQERAFIMRLSQGTIENRIYLEYVTDKFSGTPVKKMKPVIRNIILMSVYQILFMTQVPDSAVCNEAVKLAAKRGFNGLKGFVNGVLRNISRNKDDIEINCVNETEKLSITYSMPQWIVEMWCGEYGMEVTEKILSAFLTEKKTFVRCRQDSVEKVKTVLTDSGIKVSDVPYIDYALCLSGYNYLGAIKEFNEGLFQVQDVSSMLVGIAAAPQKGNYVIDVCAAPGGKATHVAELMENTGHVDARDISDYKTKLIESNIQRLGLKNITVKKWDAVRYDENSFEKADILICDLPCSGLGVLGRKPDIKYRVTKKQLDELVKLQREILNTVWKYVKPGGRLVYSTCTINSGENEENVRWITENLPFDEEDISDRFMPELCRCRMSKGCIRLLPGMDGTDGFFISSLIRR